MYRITWRISGLQRFWVPLLVGIDIYSSDYKRCLGLRMKKELPLGLKAFIHGLQSQKTSSPKEV